MEKASKALRRSGVRIKSIGSGHSDLQMVISQLKDVRQEEIHRASAPFHCSSRLESKTDC